MKPRHRRDLSDAQLIRMIAARALNAPLAVRPSRVDLRAAIAAAHAAQRFDLRALLNASDYTFFDRIHGIHHAAARGQPEAAAAHRPEKWEPVFGQGDAPKQKDAA